MRANGKAATAHPHRALHFHFLHKPMSILGDHGFNVAALELQPQVQETGDDGKQRPVAHGESVMMHVQLLLKSVGYKGLRLPGVPFDDLQGTVPNVLGRVTDTEGVVLRGLYVTGWIKRGPQGIIGTNIMDADQTATCVAEDLPSLPNAADHEADAMELLEVRAVALLVYIVAASNVIALLVYIVVASNVFRKAAAHV
jgi:NADPH-dependent glutamate synthase beta subunit-like oxidoreductase